MTKHTDKPANEINRKAQGLPQRTQILIGAGIALFLVAGLFAVRYLTSTQASPPASPAPPGTFRPTKSQWENLKIAQVQTMSFRSEQITDGVIAYNDDTTTPVFSPFSGQVTHVIAKLGDVVKKGDPLMTVAASEFVQARSNLINARAQLTLATATEKRLHGLYEAKAAALKDWQQSQADLTTAQSNLQAVQNQLRILGKSDSEIDALETEKNVSGINPEVLVRAPVSGTVIQRQVGLGQNIQSVSAGGANPVFTIGNLSTVWLVANVRESDAPLMRVGQPAEVHVLAFPERVFKARISWVAPAVDPNTHRLPVRAEIKNTDGELKPMMFASFNIVTSHEVSSIGIPQSSVVYEGSETHVFVANSDSTLAVRPIGVGRATGDMLEVTSGLTTGDKIVTRGALFIDRAAEGN
jgi:cobalt-zinc-cadmium efflux system membrane fusion protein